MTGRGTTWEDDLSEAASTFDWAHVPDIATSLVRYLHDLPSRAHQAVTVLRSWPRTPPRRFYWPSRMRHCVAGSVNQQCDACIRKP
jgi:hypothetical protein